jgi:tetratricopeptide (TPR) repeat protein
VLNEALGIERDVFGPGNQRLAQIESHLAMLYERQGDLPRAIQAARDAVQIATDRLGLNHYLTGYYLDSLASLYFKSDDLAAAEDTARRALAVYARTLPARHLYIASTRQLLGEILVRRGNAAAAETELRAAIDTNVALVGADSWRTARAQASLGWALVAAHTKLQSAVGPKDPATQWAASRLTDYLRAHHRDAEAAAVQASAR